MDKDRVEALEALYSERDRSYEEVQRVLDRSAHPKGSESLYETVGASGSAPTT
jgi:hypothetical protein